MGLTATPGRRYTSRVTSAAPSTNRSGGLITFEAQDEENAKRAVNSDPFALNGLLETYWLKRWKPE